MSTRVIKRKPCIVCGQDFQPTGSCAKYCSVSCKGVIWSREWLSGIVYAYKTSSGEIKRPGIGTGQGQPTGAESPGFKPDARRSQLSANITRLNCPCLGLMGVIKRGMKL